VSETRKRPNSGENSSIWISIPGKFGVRMPTWNIAASDGWGEWGHCWFLKSSRREEEDLALLDDDDDDI
jgi:hypothetical protein